MKTITHNILFTLLLAVSSSDAQTNVSGGIFANTNWTLAGSPYVVTGNVVVFPGYTLSIDPGVTIKFNPGTQLEIREAALIAIGTSTDSIIFTSNSSQSPGSWNDIFLNGGGMASTFNFCNFSYATSALFCMADDSLIVKNSVFSLNTVGLHGSVSVAAIIDSCNFIDNVSSGAESVFYSVINFCTFSNSPNGLNNPEFCSMYNSTLNNNGTGFFGSKSNVIYNCTVRDNQTGIHCGRDCRVENCTVIKNQSGIITGNTIHDDGGLIKNNVIDSNTVEGINVGNRQDSVVGNELKHNAIGIIDNNGDNSFINVITKNIIENNLIGLQSVYTYDMIFCNKICNSTSYDLKYTGTPNTSFSNNYFCTSDSTSTEALIYDGYDNVSYGLVNFMPLDTSNCYTVTGIPAYDNHSISFNIFPNPATDELIVGSREFGDKKIDDVEIYDALGQKVFSQRPTGGSQQLIINVSSLVSGMYVMQMTIGDKISRQKFIKQ